MKKNFLSLGLIAAAAFTLTNCTQEIANPVEPSVDGVPFEIVASPAETKTTNDGMSTVWATGDAINLFHAEAGETTYVSDGQFTLTSENTFKGTLNGTLVESYNYDWFAFYPYSKYVTTPASRTSGYMPVGSYSNASQTQKGNSSMSHIAGSNYPLAGKLPDTEYEAGTPVSITMSHLTSLLEVVVTNTSDEDLTVTNVSFTAPESVVGTYYIDFTGEAPVFTPRGDSYVSKTASLKVTDGAAISKNASAKFYLAVKPFTATANQKLTLSVNGYPKEVTVPSDMTFAPGVIKTLNFNYDQKKVEKPALPLPWFEDFSTKDLSNYVVVDGGSETKLFEDCTAGGDAPEILIAKNGGSLSVNFDLDGYFGDLTLSFLANYYDRVDVQSSTTGVVISNGTIAGDYQISVPEETEQLQLTILNTTTNDNVRIDDLSLVKGIINTQKLSFTTSSYTLYIGSDDYNNFNSPTVLGAMTDVVYESSNTSVVEVDEHTGEVTLKGLVGEAEITATALATSLYKSASASYKISLKEIVGGSSVYVLSYGDVPNTTTSYVTAESIIEANDKSEWALNGYIKSSSNNYIQLGKGGANYITTPSSPTAIKKITVVCGSSYNLTICSLEGDELMSKKPGGGSNDYDNIVEFDLSSLSYSQVKIVSRRDSGTSNAAVYIDSVTVEY